MRLAVVLALLFLAACDDGGPTPTYTLYRNSPLDPAMRIHWATFNAADKGVPGVDEKPFNQGNCELAADVLNANLRRIHNGELPARFWCEKGNFRR